MRYSVRRIAIALTELEHDFALTVAMTAWILDHGHSGLQAY